MATGWLKYLLTDINISQSNEATTHVNKLQDLPAVGGEVGISVGIGPNEVSTGSKGYMVKS